MTNEQHHESQTDAHEDAPSHGIQRYVRFAAMILTAMVVMYGVMFMGTYAWGHVRWSESKMGFPPLAGHRRYAAIGDAIESV